MTLHGRAKEAFLRSIGIALLVSSQGCEDVGDQNKNFFVGFALVHLDSLGGSGGTH